MRKSSAEFQTCLFAVVKHHHPTPKWHLLSVHCESGVVAAVRYFHLFLDIRLCFIEFDELFGHSFTKQFRWVWGGQWHSHVVQIILNSKSTLNHIASHCFIILFFLCLIMFASFSAVANIGIFRHMCFFRAMFIQCDNSFFCVAQAQQTHHFKDKIWIDLGRVLDFEC